MSQKPCVNDLQISGHECRRPATVNDVMGTYDGGTMFRVQELDHRGIRVVTDSKVASPALVHVGEQLWTVFSAEQDQDGHCHVLYVRSRIVGRHPLPFVACRFGRQYTAEIDDFEPGLVVCRLDCLLQAATVFSRFQVRKVKFYGRVSHSSLIVLDAGVVKSGSVVMFLDFQRSQAAAGDDDCKSECIWGSSRGVWNYPSRLADAPHADPPPVDARLRFEKGGRREGVIGEIVQRFFRPQTSRIARASFVEYQGDKP